MGGAHAVYIGRDMHPRVCRVAKRPGEGVPAGQEHLGRRSQRGSNKGKAVREASWHAHVSGDSGIRR